MALFNYTLEDVINHLSIDGIDGVQPVITQYDWNTDDVRVEGAVRVTIWLKRNDETEREKRVRSILKDLVAEDRELLMRLAQEGTND